MQVLVYARLTELSDSETMRYSPSPVGLQLPGAAIITIATPHWTVRPPAVTLVPITHDIIEGWRVPHGNKEAGAPAYQVYFSVLLVHSQASVHCHVERPSPSLGSSCPGQVHPCPAKYAIPRGPGTSPAA